MDTGEFSAAAGPDWRVLAGEAHAWFGAGSMSEAAALVRDVVAAGGGELRLDVRTTGVGVRVLATGEPADATADRARAVSVAAARRGVRADPRGLRVLRLVAVTTDVAAVSAFWREVLGYREAGPGVLRDPLQRRPDLHVRNAPEVTPLRSRMHLDVVLPDRLGQLPVRAVGTGGRLLRENDHHVTLADADGNETDVVNGGPVAEDTATSDWRAMFSGMTAYRCPSTDALVGFVEQVAGLVDASGAPLLVDVRGDRVVLDSGKDRWEAEGWAALAADVQRAAGALDLRPDLSGVRFLQLMVDALDPTAVQHWWRDVLGYTADSDAPYADTTDPRWRDPVLMFQPLEPDDPARRAHQDRLRLEVELAPEDVDALRRAATGAGGRLLEDGVVTDPEGNLLQVVPAG